ncbi:MBOAT family protein [Dokdonia sinensis]|uniref:MBOAT family protein n=1 Tax=Dokdonia sinensis TaxID=2479847 RepID=A0A3M0G462_9FLAO|nr:MBOAT family O-acyltransferase [Dokdonia sinensis]RMB56982.1 MBOAT family protein [Dokdonia sinensis]
MLILGASYFFYGVWDWRFLILIFLSSIVDYGAGRLITLSRKRKKDKQATYILYTSLIWNLGVLFIFKYYNFFLDNLKMLFDIPENTFTTLNILVPVGLSFYTFQTISYTVDVYKGKISASDNLLQFLCFVSFFPQLVAGPIERASRLLPQFANRRKFNYQYATEGLRLILWGLFKKMVVADNLAVAVFAIYAHPENFSSPEIIYGALLFFFQMYCDFSGYTDIARGTAKMFGFELSINFKLPYLVKNVSSFWDRWHITLSKWFRDYVYVPFLQNKKRTQINRFNALMLTMTLMGFWHGANWTFLLFGISQALILWFESIPIKVNGTKKNVRSFLFKNPIIGRTHFILMLIIGMIFFRSADIASAWEMIMRMFTSWDIDGFDLVIGWKIGVLGILLLAEYLTRTKDHPLQQLESHYKKPVRWLVYYGLVFLIIRYGGPQEEFIYFQF